jgi:hypothetical protein
MYIQSVTTTCAATAVAIATAWFSIFRSAGATSHDNIFNGETCSPD